MQVGFKALAQRYSLALAHPLRVESLIGTNRVYPQLEDAYRAQQVVDAVRSVFEEQEDGARPSDGSEPTSD